MEKEDNLAGHVFVGLDERGFLLFMPSEKVKFGVTSEGEVLLDTNNAVSVAPGNVLAIQAWKD